MYFILLLLSLPLRLSLNTHTHHLSSLFSLDMLDLLTPLRSAGMSGLVLKSGMQNNCQIIQTRTMWSMLHVACGGVFGEVLS